MDFGLGTLLGGVASGGADILGGLLGAGQNRQAMRAGMDFQRDVLKNQLQWRMQDAKKAGLHPLAAMGMMPASVSPVAIGGDVMSESLSRAGQSVGRALNATDETLDRMQKDLIKAQTNKVVAETEAIGQDMLAKMNSKPGLVGIQPENTGSGIVPKGQTPVVPWSPLGLQPPGGGQVNVTAPQRMMSGAVGPWMEAGMSPDTELMMAEGGVPWFGPSGRGNESPLELIGEMGPGYAASLVLRNQAFFAKHGYDNWWDDMLRVMTGRDPNGPIKSTHEGMIPPSAIGALTDLFKGANDAIKRALERKWPDVESKRLGRKRAENDQRGRR